MTRAQDDGGGRPTLVVGVGASAGGLSAFKELLAALPADSGMAFLLVQHLDPSHESLLGELLAPHTEMAVVEARHDRRLEPDTVYIIRPDTALAVRAEHIELSAPTLHRGVRLPVDHLFRSLAREYGARAAAIVLSGAGSDGSAGLREVKAAGGLTIAQEPESSAQLGMPRSAIETGLVDLVLEIGDMPAALQRFARLPEHARIGGSAAGAQISAAGTLDERSLGRLAAVLETHLDFDLRVYKSGTIERRVLRRMGLAGYDEVDAYLGHLRQSVAEQQTLVRDLLISVTDFFRDPASFDALRELVIDPLVQRTPAGTPLRVWVPGCATGEEAYSIGMQLLDAVRRHGKRLPVQLFATDIDQDAVAFGRAGIYPPTVADQISEQRLIDYFEPLEGKGFRVRTPLRDAISFAVHDLTKDPPFSRMHLISCRNVLIYLTPSAQKHVLRVLHFGLEPDGHLMLSTSESTGSQRDLYVTVSKSQRIYRKVGMSRPISTSRSRHSLRRPLEGPGRLPVEAPSHVRARSAHDLARKTVIAALAPPTIIVRADGIIQFMHGELRDYLQFPQGDAPQLELGALLRPSIATRTRGALYKCRRARQVIVALSSFREGGGQQVRITARPAPQLGEGSVMLTFEALPDAADEPAADAAGQAGPSPANDALITQLEQELQATREDLRNTVEELETSNEQLRSSNEESMSMNEELQSANEELEATTEELRSLNEELTTVNAQLREKVEQLERAHDDLNNLFASTKIATLFLDERLCIQRFTPAARQMLDIDHADIGRRVGDIARDLLQNGLVDDVRRVLDELTIRSRELAVGGRWIDRRVLPYRTESRRIDGVVVTFSDVTDLRAAHRAMEIKSRRLEMAWEAARGGIYEHRVPPDDEAHFSEQWAQVLGYRPDELPAPREIPAWFVDQIHPDDRPPATAAHAAFADGRSMDYDVELRVRHRRGDWIWVRSVCKALERDRDGRLTQVLGMTLDISAQKEVESALWESQLRFREMTDSLPLIVWVHGPDGQQEYVNETFCRFFGVTRAEMKGGRWQMLVHPDDAPISAEFLQTMRERRPFHNELRVRRADGAWRTIESWSRPRIGPDGELRGYVGTSVDVTERRATEDALRESGARFRLLADNMAQLAWMADGDGRPLWFNKRWYAYTGSEPSQVDHIAWSNTLHPEEADRVVRGMQDGFDAGALWSDTFRLRSVDGEYRWFLCRMVPVRGEDGEPGRWLATYTDVTDRRQAERRLMEADRQKNEFLAMLGHELRNPLAAINSAAATLRRRLPDTPGLERSHAALARQTAHMSKLLDGLLDISRIIRGKITLDRAPVDLVRICEAVAADLIERAPDRQPDLTLDMSDRQLVVDGDPVRLTQIIDNLLSNAIKYTAPGGAITFRTRRSSGRAVIEIADEGVGIEGDKLESIFDSFWQSEQSIDRAAGGLGLGLALVKSLTELHDGTVEVRSDGPGHGARFVVRLPLGTREVRHSLPPQSHAPAMRLLIVEDSVDNAELLRDLFELAGHSVALAGDGAAGVRAALEGAFDAVVCDIGLPGRMSGFDVAKALRRDPKTRDLALLAVSGYGSPEDVDASLDAGFDGHLTKPVDVDALERRLQDLCAKRTRPAAEAVDC